MGLNSLVCRRYPRLEDNAPSSGRSVSVVIVMLIVSVFAQVIYTTYYGIVDVMLLDAHVMRNRLAASMDVNDFVHVNCAYLRRASGSGRRSSIVPVPIGVASSCAPLSQASAGVLMLPPALAISENPSTTSSTRPPSARLIPRRTNVDVTEYLNLRSPLEGSGFEDQLNQYGSNISHGEGGSPSSDQHRFTPRRKCSPPTQVSPQPTPSQPLAGAGEVHSLSEGRASPWWHRQRCKTWMWTPCSHHPAHTHILQRTIKIAPL